MTQTPLTADSVSVNYERPTADAAPSSAASANTAGASPVSASAPAFASADAEARAMDAIRALDPGFARFEDLRSMPEAEEFHRLVMKGHSLSDAFRLARFDTLVNSRAAEAGKTALTNAYNRSHLSASAVNGAPAHVVPAETLEMYRLILPGLRDEDYRAHYLRTNAKR